MKTIFLFFVWYILSVGYARDFDEDDYKEYEIQINVELGVDECMYDGPYPSSVNEIEYNIRSSTESTFDVLFVYDDYDLIVGECVITHDDLIIDGISTFENPGTVELKDSFVIMSDYFWVIVVNHGKNTTISGYVNICEDWTNTFFKHTVGWIISATITFIMVIIGIVCVVVYVCLFG